MTGGYPNDCRLMYHRSGSLSKWTGSIWGVFCLNNSKPDLKACCTLVTTSIQGQGLSP